jgi:outer membrane protein OmpA-like peptidoglycan-associated protein
MRWFRAGGAALLLLLGAYSAEAQEGVAGEVLELVFPVQDLVFRVEDLGGAVQNLQIKETEEEIRIELAADVLFDFDKADLRPEAQEALGQVAGIVREHPGHKVRVEGHTDAKGSEAYNQKLSERRAGAVRDWLVRKESLQQTAFGIVGLGESRPAAPNTKPDGSDDPEGRQRNRRVEIIVRKE